ncbi:Uncharacterised protein [Burkholderia pseudomallei]|nr:Uncharacterised protein [Burkholderia pseudomallei]
MNGIKAVLLLGAAIVLGGCADYTKFVEDDLKIPYVYMPPNNLDYPYTLVQSTSDGNFQTACSALLLTGMTQDEIKKKLQYHETSTFGVKNSSSTTFNVTLEKAELGTLDAKYTRINKVGLTLSNGKIVTLPDTDVSLAAIVAKIASTSCKDNLRILSKERPDSTFYIPMQLYSYDIQYHIYTDDGTDVTAELPKEVTQLVLAKAGLSFDSATDATMSGDGLYVGFRGTPITTTLAPLVTENTADILPSSMVILHDRSLPTLKIKMKEREKVLDVTSFVKELVTENK